MVTAAEALELLGNYQLIASADELPDLAILRDDLGKYGDDCFSRSGSHCRITVGSIVANGSGEILSIHHLKADNWLFPGGHIEDYDSDLWAAALRELGEEAQLDLDVLVPLLNRPGLVSQPGEGRPHSRHFAPVPAVIKRISYPGQRHRHFDLEFLLKLRYPENPPSVVIDPGESLDHRWIALGDVRNISGSARERIANFLSTDRLDF